jgi:hypothetical protein
VCSHTPAPDGLRGLFQEGSATAWTSTLRLLPARLFPSSHRSLPARHQARRSVGSSLVLTCATAVLTRHSPPERGALPRWFTSCGRHELRCRGGLRLHSPGPLWPGCGGVPCRTPRRIGKPERPDVPQPSGELAPCAGRDSNPHLPLLGGVLCLLSYRQPPRVARWAPHLGPRCAGLPVRLRAPAERVCWVITGRPKRADDSMACRRVLRLVAPGLMSPELVPCVSRAGIEPTCLPAWAEVNPVT